MIAKEVKTKEKSTTHRDPSPFDGVHIVEDHTARCIKICDIGDVCEGVKEINNEQ